MITEFKKTTRTIGVAGYELDEIASLVGDIIINRKNVDRLCITSNKIQFTCWCET